MRYRAHEPLFSREEFGALVDEAVQSLPDEVQGWLDNVAIVVAQQPSGEQLAALGMHPGDLLFGLYVGLPKTKRGFTYGEMIPDKILIFQGPIERVCRTQAQVREQVRRTVLHEIGHHFGLDEADLDDAGL